MGLLKLFCGTLTAPLVRRTAVSAAESRAFCFSNASNRASMPFVFAMLVWGGGTGFLCNWVAICGVASASSEMILSAGREGRSFSESAAFIVLALFGFSDPDAGGVGGRARVGGGDGSGGASSSSY